MAEKRKIQEWQQISARPTMTMAYAVSVAEASLLSVAKH
jgi:hypothetical protein